MRLLMCRFCAATASISRTSQMTRLLGISSLHRYSDPHKRTGRYAVPDQPVTVTIDESKIPSPPDLDHEMVEHLERLSLVRFSNEDAIKHLHKAIRFADELQQVDTEGVEPLYSVLENEQTALREDVVAQGAQRTEMLANAAVTVEDYFVTPPGNIELSQRREKFGQNVFEELKELKRSTE